jgi:hypothetical protein
MISNYLKESGRPIIVPWESNMFKNEWIILKKINMVRKKQRT